MIYNSQKPHRRSIRLKHYDYSQPGAYFITICAHNRQPLFGQIRNDQMTLNELGLVVHNEWIKSEIIRKEIKLDVFIVMPNHFHGIVFIQDEHTKKKTGDQPVAPTGPGNKSISSLVAGFKSAVTKQINEIRKTPQAPVWQRNYYEHIIRHEQSLETLREYIIHNVQTWHQDELFCI